jgi:hypothetical protein
MRTNKCSSSIALVVVLLAITFAFPGRLPGQTLPVKSSRSSGELATQSSVQVGKVDAGNLDLSYSFQIAIYENLVVELNKTKQFEHVFRDGDVRAGKFPNLLMLKTTVEKYTPGSETRRAVTTVSGATKLTVRSELLTREGKVVFERSVNGDVRFFGSNLRATHNLAHNIAKTIKQASWSGSGQLAEVLSDATCYDAECPVIVAGYITPYALRAPAALVPANARFQLTGRSFAGRCARLRSRTRLRHHGRPLSDLFHTG